MNITPIHDRLLLRVIEDKTTRGGLFVPAIAHANSPMGRGEVIAAGAGRIAFDGRVFPLVVHVGDIVWFSRPPAQAIPYDDGPPGSVVMVREADIVAVLTDLPRDTGLLHADGAPALVANDEAS